MSTTVALSRHDEIARVTFLSEKGVQILSQSTRNQLSAVLDKLEQDAQLRVVVFEADGRTFIAGADIQELRSLDRDSAEEMAREGQELMNRIASLKPVTIAAVHAACAGGGCELALACDFRIAAESARIGAPEVSLGVLPGWGGTVRAFNLLGGAVARRMILSGELLPADEALKLGIVDSVFPDVEFRGAVEDRIGQVLKGGPLAIQRAKRLLADFEGEEIAEQLAAEARAFAECFSTEEPEEGTSAFLEKRPPSWEEGNPG